MLTLSYLLVVLPKNCSPFKMPLRRTYSKFFIDENHESLPPPPTKTPVAIPGPTVGRPIVKPPSLSAPVPRWSSPLGPGCRRHLPNRPMFPPSIPKPNFYRTALLHSVMRRWGSATLPGGSSMSIRQTGVVGLSRRITGGQLIC
jgi:hypothetical protein